MMKEWGLTAGMFALMLGGAMGSLHRAIRSPTQETWSEHRIRGWRLPSQKTASDVLIGAICSVGIPKFGDLLLPDFINLKIESLAPAVQWALAYGIAFVVSWEATVRSWLLRERGREPEIKNAAPALQPAKSIEEIKVEKAVDKAASEAATEIKEKIREEGRP